MRILPTALTALALLLILNPAAIAGTCNKQDALGVSRTMKINTFSGPSYGAGKKNHQLKLGNKELVLTFDDGPHERITPLILKALEEECVKATFFMVGQMARTRPYIVARVADNGHTIATHSWSHPSSLPAIGSKRAIAEIEKGILAISKSLYQAGVIGQPAPFFRFPGLNSSQSLINYLKDNNIAIFDANIDPRDWARRSPTSLLNATMRRIRRINHGIVLLHDIQPQTARMLPQLLRMLKREGYKIVHIEPAALPSQMIAFSDIGLRTGIFMAEDAE